MEIQSEFAEGQILIDAGEEVLENAMLLGDRQWLYEAVFNLVDNSLKYAGSSETIRVKVGIRHENIHIVVQDFGKGIAKKSILSKLSANVNYIQKNE